MWTQSELRTLIIRCSPEVDECKVAAEVNANRTSCSSPSQTTAFVDLVCPTCARRSTTSSLRSWFDSNGSACILLLRSRTREWIAQELRTQTSFLAPVLKMAPAPTDWGNLALCAYNACTPRLSRRRSCCLDGTRPCLDVSERTNHSLDVSERTNHSLDVSERTNHSLDVPTHTQKYIV